MRSVGSVLVLVGLAVGDFGGVVGVRRWYAAVVVLVVLAVVVLVVFVGGVGVSGVVEC